MGATRARCAMHAASSARAPARACATWRLALLWKATLVGWNLSFVAATVPDCSAQGLCSVGNVSRFTGDVHETGVLKQAIERCSYNRELIVISSSQKRIVAAADIVLDWQQLGMSHVLVLTLNAKHCKKLYEVVDGVCCVWSSRDLDLLRRFTSRNHEHDLFHRFTPRDHLLLLRNMVAARLLRFGYNTMFMDTDAAVYQNPYTFLKSEPLSSFQFIGQYDYTSQWQNLGFLYFQNYRTDGPVVWLICHIADQMLRLYEDRSGIEAVWGGRFDPFLEWEQVAYWDAFQSAVVGRPYHLFTLITARDTMTRPLPMLVRRKDMADRAAKYLNVSEAADVQWPKVDPAARLSLPDNWTAMHERDTQLRYFTLHMPNCGGAWPAELGGRVLQPRRRFSKAFWVEVATESGNAMFPDFEDGSQAAAAAAIPAERFAYAPDWLVGQYWTRGRHGAWDAAAAGGEEQQVLMHAVDMPGSYVRSKSIIRMATGRQRWHLAARLHLLPYYASTPARPRPNALAYHPDLLQRWRPSHPEELRRFALTLVTAAKAMKRAAVWPVVRCSSGTVGGWSPTEPKQLQYPFQANVNWLPFGSGPDPWCFLWRFNYEGCLEGGFALLPWELQHVAANWGRVAEPNALNTLGGAHANSSMAVGSATCAEGGCSVWAVTEAEFSRRAAVHSGQPVVYLDSLLDVQELSQALAQDVAKARATCPTLERLDTPDFPF